MASLRPHSRPVSVPEIANGAPTSPRLSISYHSDFLVLSSGNAMQTDLCVSCGFKGEDENS